MRKNKIFKNSIIIFSILIIMTMVGFIWLNNSYEPTQEAVLALQSNDVVVVNEEEFITFTPKNKKIEKGFIFYPGGKVDENSYSLLARSIAEEGYLVVIVPMTLDLAILSPNKAEKVIEKFSYIDTWAIGGHSLGGVMASKFASENDIIKGLVLYASYPNGNELKDKDLEVVSIYGSEDGIADLEKIKQANLSNNSSFYEINGGNHSQFGSYGFQEGDNKALITSEQQIKEAADVTVKMLERI